MPTKKKRVGFIPRDDVMRIIDELSIENNLSNSKIINILVEEALSTRGIFDKKNGKLIKSNQVNDYLSQNLPNNSCNFIDIAKPSNNTKFGNHFNPSKSTYLNEAKKDTFDLETYKKFLSFLKFQEMMDKYNT